MERKTMSLEDVFLELTGLKDDVKQQPQEQPEKPSKEGKNDGSDL
jgi:hypothetical protein